MAFLSQRKGLQDIRAHAAVASSFINFLLTNTSELGISIKLSYRTSQTDSIQYPA